MPHILDVLKERGFIAQITFEEELYKQLEQPTTFYVGLTPPQTLCISGHYIPIMAMAHMAAVPAQAHCADGWRNGNDW